MDITLPPLESIIELTGIAIGSMFLIVIIGVVWHEVVEAFVSNSDNFILRGRQLQNRLRLPRQLCLFADSDPGMSEDTVRFIGAAALPVGLMLVAIIVWGISLGARHEEPDRWFCREARMGREAAEDGGEAGFASAPRAMDDR
ncbi:hypothetical protein CGLO_11511 [Colletotrichum gloeosporioides Cg-14]|uniref:Uncharacterized protein n=1 Tax=Colletotrichum gloeosporioides (strain Cg-14) TaxID=1237896 RepID=T0K0L5_COLGC|nr:hypothetical protein CGLO_11511 [Colletotrichum gloeosporioides Cg-14]